MTIQVASYVHEGIEVRLTGREAVKTVKALTPGREGRTFTLHEVTPVDTFLGEWKKWVQQSELFVVIEKALLP